MVRALLCSMACLGLVGGSGLIATNVISHNQATACQALAVDNNHLRVDVVHAYRQVINGQQGSATWVQASGDYNYVMGSASYQADAAGCQP